MAHPSGISMWDQVADMWSVWTACFLPASFAAYTMLLAHPVFSPASSLKNQHSDPCGGAAARKVTRISGSNVIYINNAAVHESRWSPASGEGAQLATNVVPFTRPTLRGAGVG